ncbi:MAG: MBL fold metallo-hydrolase [Tissierellia bacterium]|nr:MBL fold metallo-hydrolase [Tissierellia bacterium]
MKILKKNVGIYGANTYILYKQSKRAIIIDCGGDADVISDMVKAHDLEVEAILITHGHFDHITGIPELRKLVDAPVYASEKAKDLLESADKNLSASSWSGPVTLFCDGYFKDGDTLEFTDMTVQVMETPGHTEGSVVFYVQDCLFTGDTLFTGSIGRTDLYSGNYDKIVESLRKILIHTPDNTKIYPGHGPESTMKIEKENNPFLLRIQC